MTDLRPKVVFLGTPAIAARALEILQLEGGRHMKIVAAVSQPPAKSTRKAELIPSPVHQKAHELGIPVLHPEKAGDAGFLDDLRLLQPDLCITAAYGNYLPTRFLEIPRLGTLNIHPSLLPLYRGAAPVQRCLENGDPTSGVTLLFTVKEMDAGPIVAQKVWDVDENITAPEFLAHAFEEGARLLIRTLPSVCLGNATLRAQDHSLATHAPKLSAEDALMDPFRMSARALHNRARACAGWPGQRVFWASPSLGSSLELKIGRTKVLSEKSETTSPPGSILFEKNRISLVCLEGGLLELLELQPPGKKTMPASDFLNGLKGRDWRVQPPQPKSSPSESK